MRGLPSGWEWAPFEDVAAVDANLVDPSDYPDYPHIAPNHIESRTGRLLPYTTVKSDGVTSSKHLFVPGHILYSKIRPYLAKAVRVEFSGLCSADMYPVSSHLDARFLHHWLLSSEFTALAAGQQGRSVLPKINRAALDKLPVPVPPMHEQERIVGAIEEHLSRFDAGATALSAGAARVSGFTHSAIGAVLNPDWPTRPLFDVCSLIVDCPHSTAKFVESGVACVDTTNIEPFELKRARLRFVSERTYVERTKRHEPVEDDVVFGREGTVGTAVRVPPGIRLCLGQRVMLFRAGPELRADFLELVMNSNFMRRQYRPIILGTTAPHLNVRDVKSLHVPVPSLGDQELAVRVAEGARQSAGRLRANLEVVGRRAAGLRRMILAAAFAGQLVPRDRKDEPASVLLERIRAERATATRGRRTRHAGPAP